MDIVIPGLGDIDEVEVIELCVAVGDTVAEQDTILVIESDKASMDVPSPSAGTIASIAVAVGDMVKEGTLIASLTTDAADASAAESAADANPADDSETSGEASDEKSGGEGGEEKTEEAPPAPSGNNATATNVDILVPDIGDASGVVVIEIAAKAGDTVAVDDLLIVLESDKASMEIAAEQAGELVAIHVEEGQEVSEGSLIATLKVTGGAAQAAAPQSAPEASKPAAPRSETPSSSSSPSSSVPSGQSAASDASAESDVKASQIYAGPAVRRLARELGVDLSEVSGTGNRNRITKDDVKAFVKTRLREGSGTGGGTGGGIPPVATVDYAKFGEVELVDLTRIQQRGADNLHRSWVNLPHVTQHDEADITDLEDFRASLKKEAEQKGVRVTPLAFLVKACTRALQEYPMFNSSLHENRKQLVMKKYINIGMAVDTPEGLVVPVIKRADQKTIWELSAEIADLSAKARDKKLGMDDVQGGTFSISSLGALGGTGFTPIVNAPEVAILGVSKMSVQPVWNGQEFEPRKMLPLSLSYDHRVINGADGGRFMVFLTQVLGDLRRLAL